jgi:antitoxin component of MazEF toxin-antitoxin module
MNTELRKVTVMLPAELLDRVHVLTGETTTAAIRDGLRLLAERAAQRKLLELRGKCNITIDVDELREDR